MSEVVGYKFWPRGGIIDLRRFDLQIENKPALQDGQVILDLLDGATSAERVQVNESWSMFYNRDSHMVAQPLQELNRVFVEKLPQMGIQSEFGLWPVVGPVVVVKESVIDDAHIDPSGINMAQSYYGFHLLGTTPTVEKRSWEFLDRSE